MYKPIPGCKTPERLLYDISGKVGRIINNEGENIKPPVMGSDDFEKKIKDFTNKKIFNSAYKNVCSAKIVKACIGYLNNLYKDDKLDSKMGNGTNLIAFNNGYLYDFKSNEYRKIDPDD